MKNTHKIFSVCINLLKQEKSLIWVVLIYGTIASLFNILLPLSIQYIASSIIANASFFPILTICLCLFCFLLFYGLLKLVQLLAFSYFEKKFFIRQVSQVASNLIDNKIDQSPASATQSYSEIIIFIRQISYFLFTTSMLIQQVFIGLVVTAFYHFSFLVFNLFVILSVYFVFKFYFLKSIRLYRLELDVRYSIGESLVELQKYSATEQSEKSESLNYLLQSYYEKKTAYFALILKQNFVFLLLYGISNSLFLLLAGILTLDGYITVPQFLASELIFSLVFANLAFFAKSLKNIYEALNASEKIQALSHIGAQSTETVLGNFQLDQKICLPRFYRKLLKIIGAFLLLIIVGLYFVPFWQTSHGTGKMIALKQENRVQEISAMVSGRITNWYVKEGQTVKKGDLIAEISDNDPVLLEKLQAEFASTKAQYENAKIATQTGSLNYKRQEDLYQHGLTAKKDFEKVKIDYHQLQAYENEIKAKLMQADVKLARQKAQVVIAQNDGFILRSQSKAALSYVQAGEVIATFVPFIEEPAVEMYLVPNDMPLIHIGRKARIQIEGWPALRISGWPTASLGTFGGVVSVVDQAISANGRFRVLITPDLEDSPWPDMHYIKQGTPVIGWVNMNRVPVGYEIWRKLNGFPVMPEATLLLQNKNEQN